MTAEILIVADDFTGGNAAAAGFASVGLRAITVCADMPSLTLDDLTAQFDVIVAATDSRHVAPEESARRTAAIIDAAWPVKLVSNRVDTTLRGNIAASTKAALERVRMLSGRRTVAICAPAHPAAGRQTKGGVQTLNGVLLERTELVGDLLNPVSTSDVASIVTTGTSLTVSVVTLDVVTGPKEELSAALLSASVSDVIVVDALTEEHLGRIAQSAAELSDRMSWMSVDSGPFSVLLAEALGLTKIVNSGTASILAISGSASIRTRRQLQYLIAERSTLTVLVTVENGHVDIDAAVEELGTRLVEESMSQGVVLITSALDDAHVGNFSHEISMHLASDLAQIAHKIMSKFTFGGLFTTGGDVTAAVFKQLHARGLNVEGEVLPLAVVGSLVGGPWDGLPIVTKGGLIGDADATLLCIEQLETLRDAKRRAFVTSDKHVPSYSSSESMEENHV